MRIITFDGVIRTLIDCAIPVAYSLSYCSFVGVGTMRIKTFDDVIRTLIDVRYVLELRKSPISLGCLDTDGSRFVMSEGVLKVNKGSS